LRHVQQRRVFGDRIEDEAEASVARGEEGPAEAAERLLSLP
jgi:hypothetical protein